MDRVNQTTEGIEKDKATACGVSSSGAEKGV